MTAAFLLALASVASDPQTASPCDEALANLRGSNIFVLRSGSSACKAEDRADDAAFFEFLIRIRFSTDLAVLPPEEFMPLVERMGTNEGLAQRREFVDETIARDPERFERLLDRVRAVDLKVPPDYKPGWEVRTRSKPELYTEVVKGTRTDEIARQEYVARLVRDDIYYAAYIERVEMLAKLSDGANDLPERYGDTTRVMRERKELIGEPPTGSAVPWRKVYAPGPDAGFTVLHRGVNGPEKGDATLFRSADEVRGSWVADALTPEELANVLEQVDFQSELMGLRAIGEMVNATENIFVTQFEPSEFGSGYTLSVRVGVSEPDCDQAGATSYPFVLVKAKASDAGNLSSYSRSNYPDQCAPVLAGEPTIIDAD